MGPPARVIGPQLLDLVWIGKINHDSFLDYILSFALNNLAALVRNFLGNTEEEQDRNISEMWRRVSKRAANFYKTKKLPKAGSFKRSY